MLPWDGTPESLCSKTHGSLENTSPTRAPAISESKPLMRLHLHSTEAAGVQIESTAGLQELHGFEACSHTHVGASGGSVVKHPPAMWETIYDSGDAGSIPGSGRFPWRREWQPTPVFLPKKPHGQGSLTGYSPWGRRARHGLATKPPHTHIRPSSVPWLYQWRHDPSVCAHQILP